MTSTSVRHDVDPALSVTLDLTRVCLALIVAIGHWTHFFQDAIMHVRGASAAVAGFFVLSGFTIRMFYPSDVGFNLGKYAVERVSRIWSVAIPALVLTVALDAWSYAVDTDFYLDGWGENIGVSPGAAISLNLFGLAQIWGLDFRPLSNHPFWSISYEMGFYAMFGLWLVGKRIAALAVGLILGPNIVYLMGYWLLGALLYEVACGNAVAERRRPLLLCALIVGSFASALLVFSHGQALVDGVFGVINVHPRNVTGAFGGWALLFLGGFAAAVWAALNSPWKPSAPLVRAARWLGNLTFPIYLFHFPLFVLLGALGLHDRDSVLHSLAAFIAVCLLIAWMTPLTDWLKVRLRTAMAGMAQSRRV